MNFPIEVPWVFDPSYGEIFITILGYAAVAGGWAMLWSWAALHLLGRGQPSDARNLLRLGRNRRS